MRWGHAAPPAGPRAAPRRRTRGGRRPRVVGTSAVTTDAAHASVAETHPRPPQHGRGADIGSGAQQACQCTCGTRGRRVTSPQRACHTWLRRASPPLQRPWRPRVHGRRCPALARRHGATSHASIMVPRCGAATLRLRPSLMRTLAVCRPRASVTRDGMGRWRGEDMRGLVREAGLHDTPDRRAASENTVRTAPWGRPSGRRRCPASSCCMPPCTPPLGWRRPFSPPWSTRGGARRAAGARAERRHGRPLLTGPLAGRLGDRIQLRVVLVVCLGLAAVVTLGYLPAQGFGPFLALSLGHAAALAPVTILADALALGAACRHPAAAAAGSSTAGCAGRARRPSSVARCWPGRR